MSSEERHSSPVLAPSTEDRSIRNGSLAFEGDAARLDETTATATATATATTASSVSSQWHCSSNTSEQQQQQQHDFRTQEKQVQVVAPLRKRKRDTLKQSPKLQSPQTLTTEMSLLSRSSSSSSEEEEHQESKGILTDNATDTTSVSSSSVPPENGTLLLLQEEGTLGHDDDDNNNNNATEGRYGGSLSPERESSLTTTTTMEATETTSLSQEQSQNQTGLHHQHNHPPHAHPNDGWRVKLYRLNSDGSWDDCGTGSILCLYKNVGPHENNNSLLTPAGKPASTLKLSGDAWAYHELGEPTLCMYSEVKQHSTVTTVTTTHPPKILLRTRILLRDAYQRQGDNIITWCEPYLEEGNSAQGVDLALSFQEVSGCLDIWHQITQVQSNAADLFQTNDFHQSGSDDDNNENGNRPKSTKRHENVNGESGSNSSSTLGEDKRRGSGSVEEMAHAVAAAHHANLQRQQQQEMWVSVASEVAAHQHHHNHLLDHPNATLSAEQRDLQQQQQQQHPFEEGTMVNTADNVYHGNGPQSVGPSNMPQCPLYQLPNPPALSNLEEIVDTIAAVQHMQRESLAMFISQNECSYLKSLLSLFPSAESRGDYPSLATLAACIKAILLLNDPSIIELIISDELVFEEVCSTLEYDPDLRDKANHRWFLRERAKFRTVALMQDEELVVAIHRSFRVTYLRDTLLRPTMDESSLSTLSSLQAFTHVDVVKGLTVSPTGTDDKGEPLKDSYLAKIIRILGREVDEICNMEWRQVQELPADGDMQALLLAQAVEPPSDSSTVVVTGTYPQSQKLSRVWKQYLAPQDASLASRRIRRRGSISFLRELFNMVRISLPQNDKDDIFAVLVSMEVDLRYCESETAPTTETQYIGSSSGDGNRIMNSEDEQKSENEQLVVGDRLPAKSVNLLSLLGTMLADPSTDITEKGSALEIIHAIAMHDPSLVRGRCLDSYASWKRDHPASAGGKIFNSVGPIRPYPNEKRQTIFYSPPNDLLGSLMFLLAVETDAGVLLQVYEIMKTILDTDMMADHGLMGCGFVDEPDGIPQGGGQNPLHEQYVHPTGNLTTSADHNQFLSMFYDHYVQWLTVPFQYKILHPVRRIPTNVLESQGECKIVHKMIERFEKGQTQEEPLLRLVPTSAVRSYFAVELLSLCVRTHVYRMKCYLLRSRVIGNVLKVLNKTNPCRNSSGGRCLELAGLRFLRTILSVKDEFYHRHIVQHNLFAPVFEAFRANPVGDNLVSSAIVEMCDFVHAENIKSLIEHIVTKHLSANSEIPIPSLEDVSSPYVNTLTTLREAYEKNLKIADRAATSDTREGDLVESDNSHSGYFHSSTSARTTVALNEKAREDQRKFREADQEESYFDADDDDGPTLKVPQGVDEFAAQEAENELRRTPRMFSLAHAPLLNGTPLCLDERKIPASEHGTSRSQLEDTSVKSTSESVTTSHQFSGELH